jgi:hypothetical protein
MQCDWAIGELWAVTCVRLSGWLAGAAPRAVMWSRALSHRSHYIRMQHWLCFFAVV